MNNFDEYLNISTPEKMFEFLNNNMRYGLVIQDNKKFFKNEDFEKNINEWKLRDPKQILNSGVGHCYDFTELERNWFEYNNYVFKTIWVVVYGKFKNEYVGQSHSYLVYQEKDTKNWVHFEISDNGFKGLHKYKDINILIKKQALHQKEICKYNWQGIRFRTDIYEYLKPKKDIFIKEFEYNIISKATKIKILN